MARVVPLPGTEEWEPRLLTVVILGVLVVMLLVGGRWRRRGRSEPMRIARYLVVGFLGLLLVAAVVFH